MAISTVKATINGQVYDLTYDATSGAYKGTITAPPVVPTIRTMGIISRYLLRLRTQPGTAQRYRILTPLLAIL